MTNKTDWSKYEVKEDNNKINWNDYLNNNPLDDSDEEIQIPENTGISGIGSDLLQAALEAGNFVEDIPNKLEKSGEYIEKNPGSSILHNAGQLASGTAELGKGLINAPYNLNQYLVRKHLLPSVLGKMGKFIPHISEDTGIEKALGLEPDKEKGDDLIRAIPDIASMAFGGVAAAKSGKKLLQAPDLKQALRDTQAKVNEASSKAGKIFEKVEEQVDARNISKVPIDRSVIKQAESFLAKTPANKKLIIQAKSGDYKALRRLQADLRVRGEKALSSALAAENKMGEEIMATRDQVNQSIQNHLDNTGHQDLAKELNKARGQYRDIQKTYFSSPALAKVFGKSQKIPKKAKTLLTEESTEMKKLMSAHPELEEALVKALKHEKKLKRLKSAGSILGIGTTAEIAREVLGGK